MPLIALVSDSFDSDKIDRSTQYDPCEARNKEINLDTGIRTSAFPFILSRGLSSAETLQQGTIPGRNKFSDNEDDDPLPTHRLQARNPMLPLLPPLFGGESNLTLPAQSISLTVITRF